MECDRNWSNWKNSFSERYTCSKFCFSDLSHLLNVRRRDRNVNFIFRKVKFGECILMDAYFWLHVFDGSKFLALGARSLDKAFSNEKSIHLHTRRRSKKNHTIWRRKFEPLFFIPPWLFLTLNLFLLQSLLVRPCWGQAKRTHKSSRFFEFSRINSYKISIYFVLLWCKTSLILLQRSWLFLLFLSRTPTNFKDFFPRSWKILQNLANLAKNNCQDLGKKCQKSKFPGKKTETPSTGHLEIHW